MACMVERHSPDISIHTLRMEGDMIDILEQQAAAISIHTLRMEGDEMVNMSLGVEKLFQSTPSAWRVTIASNAPLTIAVNFNPHPPHGG